MWPDTRDRLDAPELMDDRAIGGRELIEALAQLRLINRLLGAAGPTIEGVERLWQQAGCPPHLTILDVGAGSGDMTRALLRWADRRSVSLHITLLDIHPETCAAAAAYHRHEPRVTIVCGDLLQPGMQQVDIVTAALFTHHFSAGCLPAVYRAMQQTARFGVVVNDLQRHALAWAAIRLATHLFSRNRMIRHDAPLSVLRGFQAADLRRLQHEPGLSRLSFAWRPLFRYMILVPGAAYAD
ncbi:MAG: methyltransferase domain-containing protein [Oscillochloris sp.]|nr:methyltransferase domain-containing protein [Oscillochloris sp.]